jgi:hypothetical protein
MPVRRRHERDQEIEPGVRMHVRRDVEVDIVGFAVVLIVDVDGTPRPVELYDCSHSGRNDRHCYTFDGEKGPAVRFHDGTPAEAYRSALWLIESSYERMIERWRR